MKLEPKPLKYTELPGISTRQLTEHHDKLYVGYVNKYNEITEKLAAVDLSATNQTYSDLRELQLEKGFALNGVKLHEAYFDNLTDKPTEIIDPIKSALIKQWGSVDKWVAEFSALGMAARGWVVLDYDYALGRFDNYIFDAHNQGGIANTQLILVMDVYEHAYFLDYATARKDYIAAFMTAIDWTVVNQRVSADDKKLT